MSPTRLTRRQALKQTFFYGAAAAFASRVQLKAAPVSSGSDLHFLMIGDFGIQSSPPTATRSKQGDVAAAMQGYVKTQNLKTDGIFMLGDNFYGGFTGGLKSPRWKFGFEEMYPASVFPGPCWAMLGNHDYNEEVGIKLEAQLAYAKSNPGTRWTMPAKWYRVDFPTENPLITALVLDSNYAKKRGLTEDEKAEQKAWLQAELLKPRSAPFLVCMAHHPVFSNGTHGDTKDLVKEWEPLFEQHSVDAYFCGHDHDLQHLQFKGKKTSYVVSGGGGARARKEKASKRGPYSRPIYGFTHLQVSPDKMTIRHMDDQGQLLHAFTRSNKGKITVLATTPVGTEPPPVLVPPKPTDTNADD